MDKGYARPTAKARELRHNATDAERALVTAGMVPDMPSRLREGSYGGEVR
ncbi:hypothetical protein NUH86_07270 [Sphingobium sp. JS3065]|nr:hypothetical protein [Sphingobium sp. JS3065]UZW56550.1 hypothetical protein NUH86_07270 [Sphingobium sp. JS3065]